MKKTWMPSEILEELDFEVTPRKVFTEDGIEIPDKVALMRDTGKMLGMVSKRYKPVHTRDTFMAADEAIRKEFGSKSYKITGFNNVHDGARSYITFDVDHGMEVMSKDIVLPRLTVTNSFDGTLKFGIIAGAFRLVCLNGLRAGMDIMNISMKHFSIDVSDVSFAVQRTMKQLSEHTIPMWSRLSKTEMSRDTFLDRCEERLMPQKLLEHVRNDQPEVANGWQMYNSFTWYLTHQYTKSFERQLQLNGQVMEEFEEVMP